MTPKGYAIKMSQTPRL